MKRNSTGGEGGEGRAGRGRAAGRGRSAGREGGGGEGQEDEIKGRCFNPLRIPSSPSAERANYQSGDLCLSLRRAARLPRRAGEGMRKEDGSVRVIKARGVTFRRALRGACVVVIYISFFFVITIYIFFSRRRIKRGFTGTPEQCYVPWARGRDRGRTGGRGARG